MTGVVDTSVARAAVESRIAEIRTGMNQPSTTDAPPTGRGEFDARLGQAMASQAMPKYRAGTGGIESRSLGAVAFQSLRPTMNQFAPTGGGEQWSAMFEDAGARHGVDPKLLQALAEVESGFDPSAISPAGAQGLMQFMPATAAEMHVDPFNPASAIDGAARYLAKNMDRFGRADLAIASYNAGAGAVARHQGIPPYAETQNYVQKVLASWEARS